MTRPFLPAILFLLLLTSACRKDKPAAPAQNTGNENVSGDPTMEFKLFANGSLVVDSTYYTNAAGDSFSISLFNYYITNIRLTKDDGFVFRENNSYHLIKHTEGMESFVIKNVPPGKYRQIEFLIGVDSVTNVTGIKSGALDPANNMHWDWNSGYIFFKMEGSFTTPKQLFRDDYAIHIGGFKSPNSCLQTVTLPLDSMLIVSLSKTSRMHVRVSAEEVFKNPYDLGFDYFYSNISDQTFKKVSENYRDMFTIQNIEN